MITSPTCAAPVASQYEMTGLGGFKSVRRGSALSVAFIHQLNASSKSSLCGRGRPVDLEYWLDEKGFNSARPIVPNKSDCANPTLPLILAACAGVKWPLARNFGISLRSSLRLRWGSRAVIQFRAIAISAPSKTGVFVGNCAFLSYNWNRKSAHTALNVLNAVGMAQAGTAMETSSA